MANNQVPVSLFYRTDGYSVGGISFDLIVNESHSFTNTVTEHPVEDGVPIADHIQNELRMGTLKGMVSNYSITTGTAELPLGVESQIRAGTQIGNPDLSSLPTPNNRAQDAYDELKLLWEARTLVTIVTVLEVYENVAIESIDTSRDGETGDMQDFEISFKQVRIVQLQEKKLSSTVKPGSPTTNVNRQASKKYDAGKTISPADRQSRTAELRAI